MRISVIGLGRMGANISRRLMAGGHEVVGFDRDPGSVGKLVADGATGAASLEEAAAHLASPRIFWVMLPAGGADRGHDRRPALDRPAGRRDHRRRQQLLQGRHPARARMPRARRPLCRRRHVGRRLGPRARLLPDDRRRRGGRAHARSDLRDACARLRDAGAHAGPRRARRPGRARLHPCRPGRRRALRQDGPQRDRIRPDAGLRRGLRHPQRPRVRQASRRTSASRSTFPMSPRCGAGDR